jgi:hypothetical protein
MSLPFGETSTAGNLGLIKFSPNFNNWGPAMNGNLDAIDTAVSAVQQTVAAVSKPLLFNQNTPSDTWVIVHNRNGYPTVTVVDSSGNWVVGGVHYDSLDQVTLTFSAAFSGKATLT